MLEQVKSALERILGPGRLDGVAPDQPLLRTGVITSIELVTILVDLEKQFERRIPPEEATAEALTLLRLVQLLGGEAVSRPVQKEKIGRPFLALAAAIVCFFLIDRAIAFLVETVLQEEYAEFLDDRDRFYPLAGAYSHDDFSFAISHHRIAREAISPAILFFGDSGTIGSFFPASESIPAHTDARFGRGRVYNLAWFGRLLAKDLMLLEGVWERRFDAVVFTVGEDTFSKEKAAIWIDKYRHISVNVPLFDRFVERIPQEERAPFERVAARLHAADETHDGAWRRFTFEHLPLMRYRPFLQYLLVDRLAPEEVYSPMRWDARRTSQLRWFNDNPPAQQIPGLLPDAVDEDQIAMLESTIRLLSARGVRAILYVEPYGPSDWPVKEDRKRRTDVAIARQIAERTGAAVVDLSFSVPAAEFLDSPAHYVPSASKRIGERIAEALEEVL